MKMNILATVNFGKQQIIQHWEFLAGDPSPYLVLMELEDKKHLAIKLENRFVKEVERVKCFLGTLNVSDAKVI